MPSEQVQTRALLFDLDGVLIQSVGAVDRCWRRWCVQYDIPDAENFHVPHGVRAEDIIRMLRPEFGPEQVGEGLQVIEDMEAEDTADITALPGAERLLSLLPADRWALVTSATRRLAQVRLAAAGLMMPEHIITAEMVMRGKPDPEPYRRGAELLGRTSVECVVVEDAPSGVSAGIAAGSRVIGVLGTHSASQLCRANWVTPSLEDVEVRVFANHLDLRFVSVAS